MADGAPEPPSPPLPEEEHFELVLALDKNDRTLFDRQYARRKEGCLPLMGLLIANLTAIWVCFALAPAFLRSLGLQAWQAQIIALLPVPVAVVALEFLYRILSVRFGWRLRGVDTNGWFVMTTVDGLWIARQPKAPHHLHPWATFKNLIIGEVAIYLDAEGVGSIMLPARSIGDRNDFHTFASVMAKYARL